MLLTNVTLHLSIIPLHNTQSKQYFVFVYKFTLKIYFSVPPTDICPKQSMITNGEVSFSGGTVLWNDCACFTCDEGYELSGDAMLTCQKIGAWDLPEPTCERITFLLLIIYCFWVDISNMIKSDIIFHYQTTTWNYEV